jgi:hypothetical protein
VLGGGSYGAYNGSVGTYGSVFRLWIYLVVEEDEQWLNGANMLVQDVAKKIPV